jgi:hypothetical protein
LVVSLYDRVVEGATTSGSVAPFFLGLGGLKAVEKERKRRKRTANQPCPPADPECRDKEWEVPMEVGGVTLLRRSPPRIG